MGEPEEELVAAQPAIAPLLRFHAWALRDKGRVDRAPGGGARHEGRLLPTLPVTPRDPLPAPRRDCPVDV